MKPLINLLFLLVFSSSFGQYSERFKKLVEPLEKIKTERDTIFFGNGNPKFIIKRTYHLFDGDTIKHNFGTSHVYYRNGQLARRTQIDDFGNYINEKLYDKKGNLLEEWITTFIDNRAKSISEYMEDIAFGDYKKTINYYRYSKKNGDWYNYKVMHLEMLNTEGVEIINHFDENGVILKTKSIEFTY